MGSVTVQTPQVSTRVCVGKTPASLERWSTDMANGEVPAYEEYIEICDRDLAGDAILFGLRMNEGVNLEDLTARFHLSYGLLGRAKIFFSGNSGRKD